MQPTDFFFLFLSSIYVSKLRYVVSVGIIHSFWYIFVAQKKKMKASSLVRRPADNFSLPVSQAVMSRYVTQSACRHHNAYTCIYSFKQNIYSTVPNMLISQFNNK